MALDALVRMDDQVPGFSGSVGIGVKRSDAEIWWHAQFGSRATTAFLDRRPESVDVEVLLGDEEALHFLQQGSFPENPRTALVRGDVRVIDRLVDRYIRVTTGIGVRASAESNGKKKRRKR